MAKESKEKPGVDTDLLVSGGPAFEMILKKVNIEKQADGIKQELKSVKSPSKKDDFVKRLKYLEGLKRAELKPEHAYILRNIPVLPPIARPPTVEGNNKVTYPDVNLLYKDLMTINDPFKFNKEFLPNNQLTDARRDLYGGVKAVFGLGEAVSGSSRGKGLKGLVKQISGTTGPKGGFFHSKLLSKKQDFSGRGTIYAEPDLGFNEAAIPEDMLWTTFEYHLYRDLARQGFDYVTAKKAVKDRTPVAQSSLNKLIKQIPIILNRAPTLMRTNVTAHYAKPIKGKTIGLNPLHLPLYAGDYDGDALTIQVPMTPEAVEEARNKLLPEHHIHDYRKGLGSSMVAPGHEAIIGSVHMTEPDESQAVVEFNTELDALKALKEGRIKENTPIRVKQVS
jgi:DNA-directed RNA polymerase subunit beta'